MNSAPMVCLLASFLLVFFPRWFANRYLFKQEGGYDNKSPRDAQAKPQGVGRRSIAAHQNSIEAFTFFAPAVLACEVRHAEITRVAYAAVAFVVLRCVYIACYLGDWSTARSSFWTLGFCATIALYVFAILA